MALQKVIRAVGSFVSYFQFVCVIANAQRGDWE